LPQKPHPFAHSEDEDVSMMNCASRGDKCNENSEHREWGTSAEARPSCGDAACKDPEDFAHPKEFWRECAASCWSLRVKVARKSRTGEPSACFAERERNAVTVANPAGHQLCAEHPDGREGGTARPRSPLVPHCRGAPSATGGSSEGEGEGENKQTHTHTRVR
jgi:hypothetical protein